LKLIPIKEATDHLHVVEEMNKKQIGGAKEGRLLLTEEWMACLEAWEGKSRNSGLSGRGHGQGWLSGGHKGCGSRGSQIDSQEDGVRRSKANDTCRAYHKLGHWAKECRSKGRKKKAQANVAEEDEGGLLLIKMVQVSNSLPISVSSSVSTAGSWPHGAMHLVEEKMFTQI
jgi:hypothetical protein